MKNPVFLALADAARTQEAVTLGIITGVKGSSPQKLGAKAVFHNDGRIQGTLGGGCLEAEIQQRAIQALRTNRPETFELLLDHDFGWDDGLICGGKVFGLILPRAQEAGAQFWQELAERASTVRWGVQADFSISRLSHTEAFDESDCESSRTSPCPLPVGWGESGRKPGEGLDESVREITPNDSLGHESTGWLYLETVTPPCALWIAGAGHIAQAVAPLAVQLDFQVTVFDDRPALANHDFFPQDVTIRADVWERLLAEPPPAAPSFALIVTRGHRHDALVLRDWIHKDFKFLGMIGSSRKARTIFEHFIAEGLATPDDLKRVACPVGITIQSQSVTEIAVSIMAQFIDKRAEALRGDESTETSPELDFAGRKNSTLP